MLLGSDHPSLRDLTNFVVPRVSCKWYNLGLQLIDPKNATLLDNLKSDSNNAEEQCTEMFNQWLMTDSKATWNKILIALRSQAVRLENVAQDVEKMLDNRVSKKIMYRV